MQSNMKVVVIGSCSVDFTTTDKEDLFAYYLLEFFTSASNDKARFRFVQRHLAKWSSTSYAPRLPKPGETLSGTKFMTSYGGKGANQCIAAAKLGLRPYMICRVGSDQWGEKYIENFKNFVVNVDHVYYTTNVSTGIAQITVADNGENQIVIVPGANGHLSVHDVKQSSELITSADILIGQLETPFEATLAAFKLCTGVKLFNAAPARKDIYEILPHCTIICVNETEASILTDDDVTLTNAKGALKKLLDTGCETVIITLGSDGAVYITKKDNEPIHVLCEPVTAVDTTGAGDAFVGALATFLLSHRDFPLHQIIGAACQVATISVTKEGTQTSFPTTCDVFNKEYKYLKLK